MASPSDLGLSPSWLFGEASLSYVARIALCFELSLLGGLDGIIFSSPPLQPLAPARWFLLCTLLVLDAIVCKYCWQSVK
jgi:hypothetical protein